MPPPPLPSAPLLSPHLRRLLSSPGSGPGRRRAHARAHRTWAPKQMAGPNRSGDAEPLCSPAAGLCAAAANQAGALARPPAARCSARHYWPMALAQPHSHWPEAPPAIVHHLLFILTADKSSQAAPSISASIGQERVLSHPLRSLFYIIYAPGAIGQSAQACLYNECKDVFHS